MSRAHVLVCDDDPSMQAAFKLILSDFYDVSIVSDGIQAAQKLEALKPDLMLLDLKMPKIDGMEVLQQIRSFAPTLRVIVVTGYQSASTAREMTKLGILDYIVKPFESKKLLASVERALSTPPDPIP